MDKPPYKVPSMAEVAAVKGTNGLKLVSTFSGCGGSCLGFEMAGYETLWASEFVPAAAATYRLNHSGVHVDESDVRDVTADTIRAVIGDVEIDVLEGSPPCASFSTAGSREKHWGKTKKYSDRAQRTDDLFFEYARLLDELQPRAFIAENVAGLVAGKSKGYFLEIMKALRDCGYRVEAQLLDASWLGVPQSRRRLIFMGIRNDLQRDPIFPKALPYRYSITDACPWITTAGIRGVNYTEQLFLNPGADDWFAELKTLGHPDCDSIEYESVNISHYAIGREWLRLHAGRTSDKYFSLVRVDSRKPIPTVTATAGTVGAAGVTHPSEARKFTIAEIRRLCSFPDDFELVGTFAQRWERLGRSVPPLMMKAVADELATTLCAI
jgi:DNA (cytosine-5)-methyltransferase 1